MIFFIKSTSTAIDVKMTCILYRYSRSSISFILKVFQILYACLSFQSDILLLVRLMKIFSFDGSGCDFAHGHITTFLNSNANLSKKFSQKLNRSSNFTIYYFDDTAIFFLQFSHLKINFFFLTFIYS